MGNIPKDSLTRKNESRACAIVHYQIDSEHWAYKVEAGNDVGRDCIIELSENDEWHNKKIECQIKGRTEITYLKDSGMISFAMDTKTINYALGSNTPFVLFLVALKDEIVYYLPIQKYFIENKELFKKVDNNKTINLHIPVQNTLQGHDKELQDLAHKIYLDGPSDSLREIES